MSLTCHARAPAHLRTAICPARSLKRRTCIASASSHTVATDPAPLSQEEQQPAQASNRHDQHGANGSPSQQHSSTQEPQPPTSTPADASTAAVGVDSVAERRRLWAAAIKPPMYSVGVIPVLVAGAAVYSQVGALAGLRCFGFALAAVFVIAWLNLSNDAFDAATGVDRTKPESVVNLTGNRPLVLLTANVFLAAGVSLLAYLIASTGDARPAAMLAFSIACGYVYQGPPFRFSYKGLGEPLCFFAFGPSATSAFYLALLPATASAAAAAAAPAAAIPPLVWLLSVCVGVTTTLILFCSHFHQIEGDTAAGKRSPLVRLGTERAVHVLRAGTALPYLVLAAATLAQLLGLAPSLALPYTVLPAALLSLPAARELVAFAEANHRSPPAITPLKKFGTKLHMAFGLSVILGLVVGRFL